MIDLPGAPVDVNFNELVAGDNPPIDVLGDRDGVATLVLYNTVRLHCVFGPTDESVDPSDGMPLPAADYVILGISKLTRFMTVEAQSLSAIYWYVL